MEVGDQVLFRQHAHKSDRGIICHITDDHLLYILSGSKRFRVHSTKWIQMTNQEAADDKNKLNASEIQSYITSITKDDGSNYHIIGKNYESGGNKFPIDLNRAMKWYLSGHELNNIYCTVELANIMSEYYCDYESAEKYLNIGIDHGYIYCAYIANIMFRTLSTQNIANAKQKELHYIRKCIEFTNEKDPSCLLDFAVCQLTMKDPDYKEAYKYLQTAYELDNDSIGIRQFLAFVLYRGLGCDKHENKAIEMHKDLAGHQGSRIQLGSYTALDVLRCRIKLQK